MKELNKQANKKNILEKSLKELKAYGVIDDFIIIRKGCK